MGQSVSIVNYSSHEAGVFWVLKQRLNGVNALLSSFSNLEIDITTKLIVLSLCLGRILVITFLLLFWIVS